IFFKKKLKPLSKMDLFIICLCFIIIGEELSWGWQIHQFSIFQFFKQYNSQDEPNFHNLEVFNGLMVEAFFYALFTLTIVGSLLLKKMRINKFNFGFRCFLLFQSGIIYW